jgi:hypothetical protein
MKKYEYMKPEVKAYDVKMCKSILVGSDGTQPGYGGGGEPGVNDPD